MWEDENHILFPAVRSVKEKKRAEAKEQFTSYYRLDIRGGEALPLLPCRSRWKPCVLLRATAGWLRAASTPTLRIITA